MIRMTEALNAWGSPAFEAALKQSLVALTPDQLPLQQGLSMSSHALAGSIEPMIIGVTEADGRIRAKVGVFFSGVIAGCSCADDPTPVSEQIEYCVLRVEIDRTTAATTITLLHE